MTNEEAIEELKRDIHNAKVTHHLSEHYKMAIKALEQEPCEDCISRQQAIDKMQELEDEDDEMYGCSIPEGFDGKRAIEALKALSSIQPTAKENLVVEDCISRQAVLDYIDKMPSELTTDGRRMIRRITLGEYISDTLPSVTPKPKTDQWIGYWDEEARCYVYECPICRNKQPFGTKYCWECGARLIKPQESDLGDYPDAVHNQFDNMTGSMNL